MQSLIARERVTQADRNAARTMNPTAYLNSCGFEVKQEGRHFSVLRNGDELYRITCKEDGHFVWTDHYGSKGGDNISLVQEIEPGTSFVQAVYRLSGDPRISHALPDYRPATRKLPERKPPVLPHATPEEIAQGRAYLQSRAISLETIQRAEQCGMVRYAPDGVLFCGYDSKGTLQNATRRAALPDNPVPKRDLKGSDKSYPPILPGQSKTVWLVEGGADALALQDLALYQGKATPTVIVTGGANVRSFFEREHIQSLLKSAQRVVIAGENEKDQATQQRTDDAHQLQKERVEAITGKMAIIWKPSPDKGKDIADMYERTVIHTRKAAAPTVKTQPHHLYPAGRQSRELER